jgi:hypothetical protein
MASRITLWIFIEWLGTAVLIFGVALTSWNIYPANIYVSAVGNLLWFAIGVHWRKWSLITIQIVVTGIYIIGMCKYWFL